MSYFTWMLLQYLSAYISSALVQYMIFLNFSYLPLKHYLSLINLLCLYEWFRSTEICLSEVFLQQWQSLGCPGEWKETEKFSSLMRLKSIFTAFAAPANSFALSQIENIENCSSKQQSWGIWEQIWWQISIPPNTLPLLIVCASKSKIQIYEWLRLSWCKWHMYISAISSM